MLKTLKSKIALVAVAGLGFGLVSTVPANAVTVTAVTGFDVAAAGITSATDVSANATEPTVYTRAGQTITVKALAFTGDTAGAKWRVVLDSGEAATITTIATGVGATAPLIGTVTGTFTVTAAMNGQKLRIQADDAADGTYEVVSAVGVVLDVVDAGAPASVSFAQSTREISAVAVDYTVALTPKDSSGIATRLLDGETIVGDLAPQTGVAASTVIFTDAIKSEAEATAAGATTYNLVVDGDPAGATGATVAGTTYTLSATLVSSGNALGATASATYTRVSNTSGLTGTLAFTSDTSATALASTSTVPNVATSNFYVIAKDSAGAAIKGVTINLALSGVTGATSVTADTTSQAGYTAARTATPTAAGSGTVTASVTTGASSISATLPVTVVGYGATAAAIANVTAAAVNGNGFKAGTALTGAWTSSRTVTSITVTVTGMDASKTAKVEAGGTATGAKVAGIASDGAVLDGAGAAYITADATGKITIPVTLTSATNGQTVLVGIYADGAGADDLAATPIVITFNDAAAALTTTPATATTSFVAASSTNTIAAAVADQFGNPVAGGGFVLTNTSVPAGMTAQTAASVNADSAGKANLSAVIGSAAGNYVYTVKAVDANGTQVGTLSTITFTATADGAPGSVTLTAGGSEDGLGTYRTWISTNGTVANSATTGTQTANATADAIVSTDTAAQALAKVGNYVVMTVSVKNAAGTGVDNVTVTLSKSDGVYLTTAAPTGGTTKLSAMTATTATTTGGGVATVYAVSTKAGSNTVTFTVGSKKATATFSAETGLLIQSIARTLSLSSSTVAVSGNAITQVTATAKDGWGNPAAGVSLTGVISGAAGRFAGGSRSFTGTTDASGILVLEITGNAAESGAGTLTVSGTDAAANITTADFLTGDLTANVASLGADNVSSATAALTVTAAAAAGSTEITAVKADVKAVSDTVATLSKAVTTIQSSVTELTTSFTAQIKSLSSAIAKISRAIAALSKRIK
jgi:hypothetical protein